MNGTGKGIAYGLLIVTLAVGAAVYAQQAQVKYGEYPVPGRQAGTTAFGHERDAEHRASNPYPAWFRGKTPKGKADEFSKYYFTQLVGPKKAGYEYVTSGLNANNLQMGTLLLQPGGTYPAHNHPASEIYFVTEGEADWYVDDEKQHVTPGSIIMHRPYAVHGWTNTSKDKPLKVVWIWWTENDDKPEVLDKGARLANPDIAQDEKTAKPFAVPIPPVQK